MMERTDLRKLLLRAQKTCVLEGEYDEESVQGFINEVMYIYDKEY